jgi:hypothetical protein
MNATPRYAVYFVPEFSQKLWDDACEWLGRDAQTDQELKQPQLDYVDIAKVTASPRFYGFHATLKAPFELVGHLKEAHLLAHAEVFTAGCASFDIELAPAEIGNFLALRLAADSKAMTDLHHRCVIEFDIFRAPITAFDIERRKTNNLTDKHEGYLQDWGYPYVFDEFRFHMTLTGAIDNPELRQRLLDELKPRFPTIRVRVDGIAICYQPSRDTPFRILQRFRFP